MDFDYTEDQQLLMTAFEGLLTPYRQPPQGAHGYSAFNRALQDELVASGFLDVASQDGFDLLEAAIVTEAVAACPAGAEVAGAAMIGPITGFAGTPLAIVWDRNKPARYLRELDFFCLIEGDQVIIEKTAACLTRSFEGVAGYPMAAFEANGVDDASFLARFTGEEAAAIRRRALIGIAAEAAGLMRGALEHTVQYVKDRQQFGQPLGHFQAIQHRLAECEQLVRATRWLAFRAADRDSDADAATACLYAQESMRKVINDCHQFSGAMGLTLEFPLHLWTYRLKILQGEAGGKSAQAQMVAQQIWPEAA